MLGHQAEAAPFYSHRHLQVASGLDRSWLGDLYRVGSDRGEEKAALLTLLLFGHLRQA